MILHAMRPVFTRGHYLSNLVRDSLSLHYGTIDIQKVDEEMSIKKDQDSRFKIHDFRNLG